MRFLGYPVEVYKLFLFTLTALIAALAGVLYYPQAGIINPAELAPIASIYLAVWVAIGGRGRLYGAVIGAAFVSLLSSLFTSGRLPDISLGPVSLNWVDWWLVHPGPCLRRRHAFCAQGHRRAVRPLPAHRHRLTARARHLDPMTGRCRNRRRRNDRASGGFRRLRHLRRVPRDQQPVVLEIGPAELRAIIGPNGAGKTTFMDIVTGKTRPDSGTVTFGERSISLLGMNEARIAREGVGRKFQRPTVFEDQTVEANLILALKANRSPWRRPVLAAEAARHGAGRASWPPKSALPTICTASRVSLSHGQKQWLEIAMLLAQEPRLLLVDEPAAGMTPAEREQTTALLVNLAKTRAVVVVEHDMEFIRRLNCRVTVLHEGVGSGRRLAGSRHPRSASDRRLSGARLMLEPPD